MNKRTNRGGRTNARTGGGTNERTNRGGDERTHEQNTKDFSENWDTHTDRGSYRGGAHLKMGV